MNERTDQDVIGPDSLTQQNVDDPDGWEAGPNLIDTELASIVLCRFTGNKVPVEGHCGDRLQGLHPDAACHAVYVRAERVQMSQEQRLSGDYDEVRVPWRGGEPVGRDHGRV